METYNKSKYHKLTKTTKSGKPMIRRLSNNSSLPVHNSTVEHRIKQAKIELGIHTTKSSSNEDRWKAIQAECKLLNY